MPRLPPMEETTTAETAEIHETRAAIGRRFLRGNGIEVGAGSRPFPLPEGAEVQYGDIRHGAALKEYFHGAESPVAVPIDAQTFSGFPECTLDFVISAHVIEHLCDPIGALVNALRILKAGGILIVVVPDMRLTFDQRRPETTLDHVIADFRDGGEGSIHQAYEEHIRYVHPYLTGQEYSEAEIQWQTSESAKRWREFDIHFHAWTKAGFEALLGEASKISPFTVEATATTVNENIFVLRNAALYRQGRLRPCDESSRS